MALSWDFQGMPGLVTLLKHPAPGLRTLRALDYQSVRMFSHIVIFWTDSANPSAIDALIAGANQYLKPIPLVHFFFTWDGWPRVTARTLWTRATKSR
jgi:hypothetical protein